jgi:hypothetical protein
MLHFNYNLHPEPGYRIGIGIAVEGDSVNRCFKTPVIIANTGYCTEKGYLENWAAEKSRPSSYIFPRAVEIGRRLLPIPVSPQLFRPGNTYLPMPSPPLQHPHFPATYICSIIARYSNGSGYLRKVLQYQYQYRKWDHRITGKYSSSSGIVRLWYIVWLFL